MTHVAPRPPTTLEPLRRLWQINAPLTALTVSVAITLVSSSAGLLVDPRTTALLGTPTWAKTFKFSLSLVLYAPMLIWAISLSTGRLRSLADRAGNVVGAVLLFEMVLLLIQGARAQPMHFNYASTFDLVLWQTMTVGIFVMLVGYVVLVVAVWRSLSAQPVIAWGVRLGLLVTLIGLLQGLSMTAPTSAQLEAMRATGQVVMIGAHTVGSASAVPDSGPGLPLLGWSTTHGDLRIGHFIGLHALQILPLVALLLARRRERWLTERHRLWLLWTAALGYLGAVALVAASSLAALLHARRQVLA